MSFLMKAVMARVMGILAGVCIGVCVMVAVVVIGSLSVVIWYVSEAITDVWSCGGRRDDPERD